MTKNIGRTQILLPSESRPVRMPMSGMGMNMHMSLMLTRNRLFIPTVHRLRLQKMRSLVITRRESVHHHRPNGRCHRHQTREREIPPRVAQARARQVVERVWQHVYESCGQDHPGCEGLDEEENVVFGLERLEDFSQDWERDADRAGCEDGGYRSEFVLECLDLVTVFGFGLTCAICIDGERKYEEKEREQDEEPIHGESLSESDRGFNGDCQGLKAMYKETERE